MWHLNQISAKLITIHVAIRPPLFIHLFYEEFVKCFLLKLLQVLLEVSVFLSLEVYYLFKVVISI
jgi:hypothetical protein